MAADQERADRIRALKQGRPDLTWRRIADHVGVTERSATDWQTKGGIEYDNAKKLAEIFEVEVDYVWRGPSEAERAPSPFTGQDATQNRLDTLDEKLDALASQHAEILEQLAVLAAAVTQGVADEGDRIVARLEAATETGRVLRGETQHQKPRAPKRAPKRTRPASKPSSG